jgi:hypothetical protein
MKAKRIIQRMLPVGYTIQHKGKHLHILDPIGNIVRDYKTGMPIAFSNSPSGRTWESKVLRDIKKYIND